MQTQQTIDLDGAVRSIVSDPAIGTMKVGDLQGIQVYKFKLNKQ